MRRVERKTDRLDRFSTQPLVYGMTVSLPQTAIFEPGQILKLTHSTQYQAAGERRRPVCYAAEEVSKECGSGGQGFAASCICALATWNECAGIRSRYSRESVGRVYSAEIIVCRRIVFMRSGAAIIFAVLVSAALSPQARPAINISGVVKDRAGAPMRQADVLLRGDGARERVATAQTDKQATLIL